MKTKKPTKKDTEKFVITVGLTVKTHNEKIPKRDIVKYLKENLNYGGFIRPSDLKSLAQVIKVTVRQVDKD